jgi:hypothetical protein
MALALRALNRRLTACLAEKDGYIGKATVPPFMTGSVGGAIRSPMDICRFWTMRQTPTRANSLATYLCPIPLKPGATCRASAWAERPAVSLLLSQRHAFVTGPRHANPSSIPMTRKRLELHPNRVRPSYTRAEPATMTGLATAPVCRHGHTAMRGQIAARSIRTPIPEQLAQMSLSLLFR